MRRAVRLVSFHILQKRRLSRFAFCLGLLCAVVLVLASAPSIAQTANPLPIPLYGPLGISPIAVRQGTLGSCYFHASIAAVAKANPAAIRKAIGGDAKNGYRVHFASGPDETVYVEDVEYGRAHSYDKSEGQWVTVLMRAYAQRALRENMVQAINRSTAIPVWVKPVTLTALDEPGPLLVAYDRAIRSVVGQDGQLDKTKFQPALSSQLASLGVPTVEAEALGSLLEQAGFYEALQSAVRDNGEVFGAYETLNQGGIPVKVLRAIMGAAQATMIMTSTLSAQLQSVHAGGTAMVARSRNAAPESALQSGKAPDWFVPGHAYTVLDYDAADGTVLLRNPWGAHPGPNGIFRLPRSVFEQSYSSYSYSVGTAR